MNTERIKRMRDLCVDYYDDRHQDAQKKYLALEVLDAFKSGELVEYKHSFLHEDGSEVVYTLNKIQNDSQMVDDLKSLNESRGMVYVGVEKVDGRFR